MSKPRPAGGLGWGMSDKRAFAFRSHADVDDDSVGNSAACASSSTAHVESLALGSEGKRRPAATVFQHAWLKWMVFEPYLARGAGPPPLSQDRCPRSTRSTVIITVCFLAVVLVAVVSWQWLELAPALQAPSPVPQSPTSPPVGSPSAPSCPPLACENGVLDGGAEHVVCIMQTTVIKQIRECHGIDIRCRSHHFVSDYTRSRWALYQDQLPGFFSQLLSQTHCTDTFERTFLPQNDAFTVRVERSYITLLDEAVGRNHDFMWDLDADNVRVRPDGSPLILDASILPQSMLPLYHGLVDRRLIDGCSNLYTRGIDKTPFEITEP